GALGCPLGDVAREQPAVAVRGRRRLGGAPGAREEIGTAHAQLAVVAERDLDVGRRRSDVAGPRVRPALARDEGAARLRLAVRLAEVHAPRLPEGGHRRRQRRAAGDQQPHAREADLLQQPAEDERARDYPHGGAREGPPPPPPPPGRARRRGATAGGSGAPLEISSRTRAKPIFSSSQRKTSARATTLMGGPEMAPHTPPRSGRSGKAGAPLDTARAPSASAARYAARLTGDDAS